jgi:hypothetical protein
MRNGTGTRSGSDGVDLREVFDGGQRVVEVVQQPAARS